MLTGLAWVREAMATIAETTKGAKAQKLARQKLALEAAYLWLEIARESPRGHELLLVGPPPVALARARRLLDGLADSPHARAARAWCGFLNTALSDRAALANALRAAWVEMSLMLSRLDEGRRAVARAAGLPNAIVPFAGCANAGSVAGRSPREVIEEACAPVHLAAFRWWGWLEG